MKLKGTNTFILCNIKNIIAANTLSNLSGDFCLRGESDGRCQPLSDLSWVKDSWEQCFFSRKILRGTLDFDL